MQTSSETSSVSIIHAYRAAVWQSRRNFLGHPTSARTPEARLIIIFESDGFSPTGQRQLPHNDIAGRIHLGRFPGPNRSYLRKLGHELVHALHLDWQRRHRRDPGYGFVCYPLPSVMLCMKTINYTFSPAP